VETVYAALRAMVYVSPTTVSKVHSTGTVPPADGATARATGTRVPVRPAVTAGGAREAGSHGDRKVQATPASLSSSIADGTPLVRLALTRKAPTAFSV
jgi:hypothetical protein